MAILAGDSSGSVALASAVGQCSPWEEACLRPAIDLLDTKLQRVFAGLHWPTALASATLAAKSIRRLRTQPFDCLRKFRPGGVRSMTAQRNDTFIFSEVSYLLLGITGNSILFDPTGWGVKPTRISTAVQRGYLCTYAVEQGRIILVNVRVRSQDGDCPKIGSVSPFLCAQDPTLCQYERPDVAINHSGSLLIGHATDNALGRTGFVEAIHAQNVIELVWVTGHIDRVISNPSDLGRFDNYSDRWGDPPHNCSFRCAFFLHFY